MMRSASRQALGALQVRQGAVFGAADPTGLPELGSQLYAVAGLLVAQPRLRRTLGDPATDPSARAELAGALLAGKVSTDAVELTKTAVSQRWSSPWDLADAIEGAGDDAQLAAAERDGSIGDVEDELFRFERILQAEGEAAGLLDEVAVPAERRTQLLDALVAGKVSGAALALLHNAVTSERRRSVRAAIGDLLTRAAARQELSLAQVISAVPLTDAQEQRLAAILSDMYSRRISVRTAIDPSVRGGLIVRVGDEVIDGSIATRFATARQGLGG